MFGWIPGVRRGQRAVRASYAEQWGGRTLVDVLAPKASSSAIAWRDWRAFADARGLKRVYQLYLARLIETLAPQSVLEVGCGTGVNLFVLSALYPSIRFEGIELTEEGTAAVNKIAAAPKLPRVVEEFSPLPLQDKEAYRHVRASQASAAQLPYSDGQFDLVFSTLALE